MKIYTALILGLWAAILAPGVYASDSAMNDSPLKNAAAVTKTYQLLHLKTVVSNSQNCAPLFRALVQATQQPLVLQFSPNLSSSSENQSKKTTFSVTDNTGQLTSHNYSILQQEVNGPYVHRVGAGSFMLNQQKVDYVIDISADTSQPNFKYSYPAIFSTDNAHCTYVGLVEPDGQSVQDFKKNIDSGLVAKQADFGVAPVAS